MTSFARAVRVGLLFCLCLRACLAVGQDFSDAFAGRQLLTNALEFITGSNNTASVEPFEPKHARKIGGHSVWISWLAPSSGLVTLGTDGSTFDTLLAVYTLDPGNDPPLQRLQEIASNDDNGLAKTSLLQFGARPNQPYEIAIDGFNGAVGNITLQLSFLASTNILPVVLRRPGDEALRLGDPLILTMDLFNTSRLELSWYLNGNSIFDANGPTLVVSSLQETNLGFYNLRLKVNDDSFFSASVEVQVNSEGLTSVLARNKLADSVASGFTPGGGGSLLGVHKIMGLTPGVIRGYSGTQIFNTGLATIDTNEPPHCGVTGGASYWFAYQAPTNGAMHVDTEGSDYDTVLAIYTYNGTLYDFANLIPVACDNNSGSNGLTSSVDFLTENARNYFVVVDGVNGARGIAHLNYLLTTVTNLPPQAPVLSRQPDSLIASRGTPVALSAAAGGTAPINYQWWRNNARLNQQTNASLVFLDPQIQDAGNYFVVVTNDGGAITSAVARVTVISTPVYYLDTSANFFISGFPETRGYQYAVDCADQPMSQAWWLKTNAFADYGGIVWVTNSTRYSNSMFVRVHLP